MKWSGICLKTELLERLQNKWITEFARNRSLEYVFHQNEVFYITFILGIIIVLCITAGYWEVDRRQEKYIRTLLEYQEKLQQSNEETKTGQSGQKVSFSPICPTISAHRSTGSWVWWRSSRKIWMIRSGSKTVWKRSIKHRIICCP